MRSQEFLFWGKKLAIGYKQSFGSFRNPILCNENAEIVINRHQTSVEHPVRSSTKRDTVAHRVGPSLSNRANMGGLHLGATAAIFYAKTCHRAACAIRRFYLSGKGGVAKWFSCHAFDHGALEGGTGIMKPRDKRGAGIPIIYAQFIANPGESGRQDRVKLMVWKMPDRASECPFVGFSVRALQETLIVALAFSKRNWIGEGKVVADTGVIVVFTRWISFNFAQASRGKIGLPPAGSFRTRSNTSWFIIYDPVAQCVFGRPQISLWKVVSRFRKVVVDRSVSMGKNGIGHMVRLAMVAVPRQGAR